MKAFIQHNFTSGLGDSIVAIHEYLETASNLIKKGYIVDLKLNLKRNVYLYDNDFFRVFNSDLYSIFNSVEIIDEAINTIKYGNYNRVYTLGNPNPGMHWWDLFIDDGVNIDESLLSIYPQEQQKAPKKINIFSNQFVEEYQKDAINFIGPQKYDSIYYRTMDLSDNISVDNKDKIQEILEKGNQTFLCSNSYTIKKEIKDLGYSNCFMFDIPGEQKYGNHYYGIKLNLDENETLLNRTKYTLYDILTLSNSSLVNFFSDWGRASNFLIMAKINKTPINTII